MISITPLTAAAIGHRALHVAVARSGHVAALSKEGIGSLLAPDHLTVIRFDLGCQVRDVAISAAGDLLAVVADDSISLVHLPDFVERPRLDGTFDGCLFSPSGNILWTARHTSSEMAALEIWETKNWQVIGGAEVPDPFENSGLMLFNYPSEDRVVLWVAAGQDGQCLYWSRYDGSKLTMQRFPELTDTAPPGFDRSGERFLVVSDRSVRLYKYPTGPELGRMIWPFDDDPPAETVSFVGDGHAIVHSGDGRLFLMDLSQMEIVDDIAIRGHEPRSIGELYPNLRRELRLCSDLSRFMPLPSGGFVSIHQELPSQSIADWRDQLLSWRIPHS